MLVIADKLRSGAEKRVVGWLRKWEGDYRVPGVAITNCFIAGQEIDLVIITPYTTVVGEVKGVDREITGSVLQCTTNSRWKVPGTEGDPVSVRENDTTPYDQVRDGVFKLKATAGQVGGSAFVTGLVVVVPPRGSTMRLEKKSAPPPGCDVLLCNTQNPLRAWFHRAHHRSAVVWTAEQAYAVVEALEYGDRITIADLAEQGFPLDSSLPAVKPAPLTLSAPDRTMNAPGPALARAVSPIPPPPTPSRAASSSAGPAPDEPPLRSRQTSLPPPDPPRTPRVEPPVATGPQPDTGRRRTRLQTAAAFAAIAIVGGGLWLLARGGGESTEPRKSVDQQISSVADLPPAAPLPRISAPQPAPAPPTTEVCYPFQANC